jgi:tetratricopeptide (TPR) repeat protein
MLSILDSATTGVLIMKLYLAIAILLMISTTSALEMREDIKIVGEGGLSAQTNAGDGQDRLNVRGEQDYSRSFNTDEDYTYLNTEYLCKNILNSNEGFFKNSTNYYYISGMSSAGLKHSVLLNSNKSIESIATIERNAETFTTRYEMKSKYGNLTEMLIQTNGAQTNYLAEAHATGNLTLNSQVDDEVENKGYEVDQSKKLNAVKTLGDPERDAQIRLELGYVKTAEQEAADLIKEGNKYANNPNEYDKALAYYNQALKRDKKSLVAAVAWTYKAKMLYKLGSYSDSIDAYEEVLKINPEQQDAKIEKALAQIESNKSIDALKTISSILDKDPGNADAWYYKGGALWRLGRFDEALSAFNETIVLDPEYLNAYFDKAESLFVLATAKYKNDPSMLSESRTVFDTYLRKGGQDTQANDRMDEIDELLGH